MQIVDKALAKAAADGKPIKVGLIGGGYSAKRIMYQIVQSVPGIQIAAIGNRTVEHAIETVQFSGANEFVRAKSRGDVEDAIANNKIAVAEQPDWVWQSEQVDLIVDATGSVEYGAYIGTGAIDNGKHLVLMNVEMDATIGPILKHKLERQGLIYSNSDGDEPGVAMNMIRFVRSLGLRPVLAGNLKGLYDPYRNPTTQKEFARQVNQKPETMTHFADGTKLSMELSVLGNAAGWGVSKRGMHGPALAHVNDAPDFYRDIAHPDNLGPHEGLVDFLVGASPSNGAFVLGYSEDVVRSEFLQYLKMGPGPLYVLYTPFHLPQLEIPNTIARAALLDDATVAPLGAPVCDSIAVAKQDLAPGTVLDGIGGYHAYALIENYSVSLEDDLLPMGISAGCRLKQAVAKDQAITYADVEFPEGRLVDSLRSEQDALYRAGW